MKVLKLISLRCFAIILAFAILFYFGSASLGVFIFLLGFGDINWWQCILCHVPAVVIIASGDYLFNFFDFAFNGKSTKNN